MSIEIPVKYIVLIVLLTFITKHIMKDIIAPRLIYNIINLKLVFPRKRYFLIRHCILFWL